MPSWRIHTTVGIITTFLIIYGCLSFGYSYLFIENNEIQVFFSMHLCFITVLGSVIPDFDYKKTRIRHALGPILGCFSIISYFYLYRFQLTEINLVFLFVLLIIFVLIPILAGLVIPFKHHGILHSIGAAAFYGLSWGVIEVFIFNMTCVQSSIIGFSGFSGYFSHLLMDLKLKLL